MRKILLFITTLILVGCTQQSQKHHLRFKGVPIDGNLLTIEKKLNKKGFTTIDNVFDSIVYNRQVLRMFGGYNLDKCFLTVLATPKTQTAYSIIVSYEGRTEWDDLHNIFFYEMRKLNKQYGEPATTTMVACNSYGKYNIASLSGKSLYAINGVVCLSADYDDTSGDIGIILDNLKGASLYGYSDWWKVRFFYTDKINKNLDELESDE